MAEIVRLLKDIKKLLEQISEKLGNDNRGIRPVVPRPRVRHIVPGVKRR